MTFHLHNGINHSLLLVRPEKCGSATDMRGKKSPKMDAMTTKYDIIQFTKNINSVQLQRKIRNAYSYKRQSCHHSKDKGNTSTAANSQIRWNLFLHSTFLANMQLDTMHMCHAADSECVCKHGGEGSVWQSCLRAC